MPTHRLQLFCQLLSLPEMGGSGRMSKRFSGTLISIVAVAGIYAVAASISTPTNASSTAVETIRNTGIVGYGIALKQAADAYRTAHAKCEPLADAEKDICTFAAKAAQKRARLEARVKYRGEANSTANAVANNADAARADSGLDPELYRAHRQLTAPRSACAASDDSDSDGQPKTPWPRVAMK